MIISDQQVRLALAYLQTQNESEPASKPATSAVVSDELVDRVKRGIAASPETRDDRVAMGRRLVEGADVSSDEVAAKMIGRIISDSIR